MSDRQPEQECLKHAHQALQDLGIVMGDIGRTPEAESYSHAINLAAHLTSSLSAADHYRRFADAEGLPRQP